MSFSGFSTSYTFAAIYYLFTLKNYAYMPLTPHTGTLGTKKAAHLLRRCTFNVTPERIRLFAGLTANQAVDYLFHFSDSNFPIFSDPVPAPGDYPSDPVLLGTIPGGNPDLMFPDGPLWQYDGALMHPPGMGASKVNHIGGRYYYDAVNFPPIASALSNDDVEVPPPFENGCGENEWETCNYLTATYLISGVYSWKMYEAIHDTSIRWKLVFWINSLFTTAHERQHYHFPHWKLMYDFVNGVDVTNNFVPVNDTDSYNNIKSYANSLKALAFAMTYSNEMLLYLDNNKNTKNGPNENYAREFLELFTILKDPNSTTQGNYVNYTEHDVVEAARVLTGFTDERLNFDSDAGRPWGKKFLPYNDGGNKTFSPAFGNHIIEGVDTLPATATDDDKRAHMDKELWEFIHMVFNQDANAANSNPNPKPTAYSFVRRMYRYFVSDKIDEVVECNIIKVLADDLYDANNSQEVNFLYIDVLKNLLKSEHFYADGTQPLSCDPSCNLPTSCDAAGPCNSIIGSKLKSPLELLLTTINLFEIRNNKLDTLAAFYKANKASFDINGYINGDRENQIIYFKSSAPVNYAGPFVKNSPEDVHPQIPDPHPDAEEGDTIDDPDFKPYNYGVQGANYEDILQLLYQHISPDYDKDSRNFIREVFHSYMFDQFGVPLQLCSFNLKGPATVEGYRGYYKEPNYSKNWLDSNNFYNRYSFGRTLIDGIQRLKGFDGQYEGVPIQYKADLIGWATRNIDEVAELNIADPKDVVETMLKYLLAIPPLNDSERFNYFLRVFVRDLPDMDWQVAWFSHPAEKASMPLVDTEAEKALKNLCYAITESHEFQTF